MIGHRQIEDVRRRRLRPSLVELIIGPAPAVRYPWQDPEQQLAQGAVPAVYTADDVPELADLRWAAGLRVSVLAIDAGAQLWARWWAALQAVQPALLASIDPETEEAVTWPT